MGCENGFILICSYDLKQKQWQKNICKEETHVTVWTLCALTNNRLLSGDSFPDYLIKMWKVRPES